MVGSTELENTQLCMNADLSYTITPAFTHSQQLNAKTVCGNSSMPTKTPQRESVETDPNATIYFSRCDSFGVKEQANMINLNSQMAVHNKVLL